MSIDPQSHTYVIDDILIRGFVMKKIGLTMLVALGLILVGSTGCGGSGETQVIGVDANAAEDTGVGVSEEDYDAAMEAEMANQGPGQ
jgi:hypothetical protein